MIAAVAIWALVAAVLLNDPILYLNERALIEVPWWLLPMSLSLFVLDAFKNREPNTDRRSWLVEAVALIGVLLAPTLTWQFGFGLVLVGSAMSRLSAAQFFGARFAATIGSGVLRAGTVLSFLFALWVYLPELLARNHEFTWLNSTIAGAFRVLGFPAASGGLVHVTGPTEILAFATSWERLGAGPLFMIVCAFVVFGFHKRAPRVWFAKVAAISALFAVVRFLVLTALVADGIEIENFYVPVVTLGSFLPLAVCIGLLKVRVPLSPSTPLEPAPLVPAFGLGALLVGVALLTMGLSIDDPGVAKEGRILIDETHSGWEWTDEPLTTELYGNKTTYNYFCMAEFLRHYFPVVDRNYEKITDSRLEDYDVIILKTPTYVYSEEEVATLHRFVEGGGGIWTIGDHTDVFGSSTCLNQVLDRYGIEYVPDALEELPFHERQVYTPGPFRRHPTTAHMGDCLVATSCSLKIEPRVTASMVGHTMFADRASYSKFNYFGDHEMDNTEQFGQFVQGAAIESGKGRVSCFSDSTMLSNFTFYFPGKWELTVSSIDWLNHKNGNVAFLLGRIALFSLSLLALYFGLRRVLPAELIRSSTLPVAILVGLFGANLHADHCHSLPEPIKPYPTIEFERDHCDYLLPLDHETHTWDQTSFHSFFVWTQRLGQIPRVAHDLDSSLRGAVSVFIRPRKEFTEDEIGKIERYVQSGGHLVVLDETTPRETSTANQLLSPFGLALGTKKAEVADLSKSGLFSEGSELSLPSAHAIIGGEPIIVAKSGTPLASVVKHGAGKVVALGFARSFAVDRMGHVKALPRPYQIALSEIEYFLFEEVLELSPPVPSGSTRSLGQRLVAGSIPSDLHRDEPGSELRVSDPLRPND